MKKALLLAAAMFSGLFATAQEGYTEVTVPLQPQYASQVYYKFATNTQTPVPAASWDLSFEKAAGQMAMGAIRVNDARIRVFQVAGSEAGYANVDVTQESTWTELFNSHLTWSEGAFDNADNAAPLAYGWGNYNPGNHHVEGVIVFVLKFSDNTYKKLFLDDFNPYNGEIAFKYSSWNGTAWSADEVKTVNPATLPASNSVLHFSLQTNDVVTVTPADTSWDLVFRQYYGPVVSNGQTVMYKVTGALQSPLVTVAQIDETGNTSETPTLPAGIAYSNEINTIGDDWKVYAGSYVIDDTNTYYIKYADGAIYRMYFTSFAGGGTGNLSFNYKNVAATAGMEDFNKVSFGFYPNPSVDKNITLIYDLQNSNAEKNTVSIYSLTGAKVFETEITNNSGFFTKDINLSALTSGMYVVTMQSGKNTVSKKLVIQ